MSFLKLSLLRTHGVPTCLVSLCLKKKVKGSYLVPWKRGAEINPSKDENYVLFLLHLKTITEALHAVLWIFCRDYKLLARHVYVLGHRTDGIDVSRFSAVKNRGLGERVYIPSTLVELPSFIFTERAKSFIHSKKLFSFLWWCFHLSVGVLKTIGFYNI